MLSCQKSQFCRLNKNNEIALSCFIYLGNKLNILGSRKEKVCELKVLLDVGVFKSEFIRSVLHLADAVLLPIFIKNSFNTLNTNIYLKSKTFDLVKSQISLTLICSKNIPFSVETQQNK